MRDQRHQLANHRQICHLLNGACLQLDVVVELADEEGERASALRRPHIVLGEDSLGQRADEVLLHEELADVRHLDATLKYHKHVEVEFFVGVIRAQAT